MDFGRLLRASWELFIREIVSLVLLTLVGAVLCLTIILIPTVMAGWARGVLGYVRDGRAPKLEQLWNFDDYGSTLLVIVVGGILICIGYVLLVVPGVILHVLWLYSLFFVVDKGSSFTEALRESGRAVNATGFFNHFVMLVIVAALGALGGTASGLGALLTTPFSLLLLAHAYDQIADSAPAPDSHPESDSDDPEALNPDPEQPPS